MATTYFFHHVMKTAGTSFAQHIKANFGADEIYPSPTTPAALHQEQYWKIAPIRLLDAAARRNIRIYHGHFPSVVASMVGADSTLTILRDPVERTISHIRHCRRHFAAHRGKALEAIYEDSWLHPLFFRNYQVKQFALTIEDDPKAHNEDIVVDADRLRLAIDNLARIDVLGLTGRYDEFLHEVGRRFGWTVDGDKRLQIGSGPEVPRALRDRIVADSWADLEFYERAEEMYHDRRRTRVG